MQGKRRGIVSNYSYRYLSFPGETHYVGEMFSGGGGVGGEEVEN